jgi:hypothetical protein
MTSTDVLSVAFGDPDGGLYGLVRTTEESAMGILFAGSEPVVVRDAGAHIETVERERRWRASLDGVFALDVEALAPPAELRLDGVEERQQLCRVRGEAQGRRVDCLGQSGHARGRADWSKLELARTVTAWLDDRTGVTLSALRPASAKHHGDEAIAAAVVVGGEPVPVADPRLSTTYDAAGRQVHAGLELWVGDGDGEYPHRAAGAVRCGTTIDLGSLRLDCAFFEWRMEGRTGVGRYDIVRRT